MRGAGRVGERSGPEWRRDGELSRWVGSLEGGIVTWVGGLEGVEEEVNCQDGWFGGEGV